MAIDTIFFDLGGVLVNFSHEKMCDNISRFSGIPLPKVKQIIYDEKVGANYERGTIDSRQVHQIFTREAKKPLDFLDFLDASSDIFSVKEEMIPLIENLSEQDVSLFLLSNTSEAHFFYIVKHFPHLLVPFDGFILSYEVKAAKPEKAIYEAALETAETTPEKSFYTDDVLDYVEAAQKLGIKGHHFQEAEKLQKALTCIGL